MGLCCRIRGRWRGWRLSGAWALEADDLGFDSVWCHDHITYDTDWFLAQGVGAY